MSREQVGWFRDTSAPLSRVRRFVLRDFAFSEDTAAKQRDEQRTTEMSERELWVRRPRYYDMPPYLPSGCGQAELLRLSRTNFSEAYQILVHVKVVRLFVESVLRYGLPAEYMGLLIKVYSAPALLA